MATKLAAAKQATLAGCAVVLACGFRELPHRIAEGKEAGTLFLPANRRLKSRERWLGLVSTPKGRVFVDAGAETALRQKGRSLLPVGIVRVEGRFAAGDIVAICSADRRPVARGVASWSHDALRRVLAMKTPEVRAVPRIGDYGRGLKIRLQDVAEGRISFKASSLPRLRFFAR